MRLHRLLTLAVTTSAAGLLATGPAAAAPTAPPTPAPSSAPGYDISHPQCGGGPPPTAAFVILGVNGGTVFSANPCLAEQTAWALQHDPTPGYYANTANPGPLQSTHWPSGQRYPEVCEADYPANDSAACAYDYGWNAAADSYGDAYAAAQQAFGSGAAEPRGDWWLDVETGNTWEALAGSRDADGPDGSNTDGSDMAGQNTAGQNTDGPSADGPESDPATNDVAALRGAVDYLTTEVRVAHVGFYSTDEQWSAITGGADSTEGGNGAQFPDNPVWQAGAGSADAAAASCGSSSFSGGPVTLVQYSLGGFDANYRCPPA